MFGVLGGALLCAGVSCEYYEIWKTGGVEGISFLSCGIDAAGDVLSVLSICEQIAADHPLTLERRCEHMIVMI